MKRRDQERAGRKQERVGAYVLHLAYCKNEFAHSDVGTIQ
jgi:hypothetical protein